MKTAATSYEETMKRLNPNWKPFEFRKAPPEERAFLLELVALVEEERATEKTALAAWLNG